MITRTLQLLFFLTILIGSAGSCMADSAKEMLAAGRIDEAIATLNGPPSSPAADAMSANLLCRAYYALEDWEGAESSCRKAVARDPGNSRFHLWLGRVYGEKAERSNFVTALGLAVKVRAEFESAVRLDPKDIEARLDLAEFYAQAPGAIGGGQDKARAQAASLATLNPGREHWVYARLAEERKENAAAEREYHQYIDLSGGDAQAWLDLALFLQRQKRFAEMEQAIINLSQSPAPRPDVLVEASETLYRSRRSYPFATELLQRYLMTGPVEEAPAFRAHYLLGTLLEYQGDKAGAAQQYRASLALVRNFGLAQQALNRVAH
jgi:tetratricopeptide (TPR) repeat protein